jgi:hypothetical protein
MYYLWHSPAAELPISQCRRDVQRHPYADAVRQPGLPRADMP